MIHKLLTRQLKRLELGFTKLPQDMEQWQLFLNRVSQAYEESDQERYLLERSLQISSKEMQERWKALDLEKSKALHAEKFATLGEIAGSIAHEINNPIGLIGVLVGQLKEMLAENDLAPDFLRDHLNQIENSVWRIAKIIKALRGFSRDGSRDPFHSVSVQKILDDVTIFCGERFKQHDIDFTVKKIKSNLCVDCREVEICQILLNLLNNAYDAIHDSNGKWIKLDIIEFNDNVEFSVANSGHKIISQVKEKMFQPFYTTKEVGKGTGLGLSIAKKIAESHGGTLYFDDSHSYSRFVLKIMKQQPNSRS